MPERTIQVGDIELWTEDCGDPADPTVLLITGPAPGYSWPDELCDDLAEGGRHVIRYDHRDTGRSTTIDFSKNPYTISDLAADAVGVLDAYTVPAAHIVGVSMGGMIAQTVALEHPGRVASLTSMMSTPGGASLMSGSAELGLPGPEPRVTEAFEKFLQATADGQHETTAMIELARAGCGSLAPVDEHELRARIDRSNAHTRDRLAFQNHYMALSASPDRTEMLAEVTAPALVIHGTLDGIFPLAHGEATARAIPGARLLAIEGMGHDIHYPLVVVSRIVEAVLEHTAPVEAKR